MTEKIKQWWCRISLVTVLAYLLRWYSGRLMELNKRITRVEMVSYRITSAGGAILCSLSLLVLAAYGFAKLIKYLVETW